MNCDVKQEMIMLSAEQKYRLEAAKDRTPGNNAFLWVVPLIVFFAWMCRDDDHIANVPKMASYHESEMPTTSLTVLGWRLF